MFAVADLGVRGQAEGVVDGRQEVLRVHRPIRNLHTVGAGLADNLPALDAAARQDRRPRVGPVISPVDGVELIGLR